MFEIRHISADFYHQATVQQVNYRVYHQSGTDNMFYESLSWLADLLTNAPFTPKLKHV